MDRLIYIVHESIIVQIGLADILRKNFKCLIKCFSEFKGLIKSENKLSSKGVIFVEDRIAQSEEYLEYFKEFTEPDSFYLVDGMPEKETISMQNTLFLKNSFEEIYEKVKNVFLRDELSNDEELTSREVEVLKLVALGYSNKEIADKLFISTHTVISHRKNMTEKLGIKSISGLTVYAIINNYIDTTNLDIKDLI